MQARIVTANLHNPLNTQEKYTPDWNSLNRGIVKVEAAKKPASDIGAGIVITRGAQQQNAEQRDSPWARSCLESTPVGQVAPAGMSNAGSGLRG
jgi:hypothetical protein